MRRNQAVVYLLSVALLMASIVVPFAIQLFCRTERMTPWSYFPALLLSIWVAVLVVRKQRRLYAYQVMNRDEQESICSALQKLTHPVALVMQDETVFWYNDRFRIQFLQGKDRSVLFYELLSMHLSTLKDGHDMMTEYQGHNYRVHCEPHLLAEKPVYAVQFTEITDLVHLQNEFAHSKPCVMLLVIDGYDDVLQYAKESEKAQLSAEVEQLLEQFMAGTRGVIRKIDNDQFYAVIETRQLYQAMDQRFSVLDDARKICVGGRIRITFSIGVGVGAETLAESEKIARQALDMALGRGGDQAAVKTENEFCFFGGASKGVEKRSKTKIRSVATALQEMIERSDQVFLMGHRYGDLDAIGSACGMAGAIQLLKKPVSIVVRKGNCLAGKLIEQMETCPNPPLFIEPEEALERVTDEALLIIVDTHNKEILESEELYRKIQNVVVIDHHRMNVNYIENAALFHHEPYASSAAEMVTEIIQYFRMDDEVSAPYANALLAGITLDTKNFVMRTGVRTFEAAAYLRKINADTIQVKSLFSDTISMHQMRSQIIAHAEIFRSYAISVVKLQNASNRLLAAQAADELLSIQGVTASFVLYLDGTGVSISARSLDKVNVQLIMEALGGGGHQSMAAAQLRGSTIQMAKERLLQVLDTYETEHQNELQEKGV